jgi:hypothetical protein
VVASLRLFAYRSFLSQRRLCFFRAVENTFEYDPVASAVAGELLQFEHTRRAGHIKPPPTAADPPD